MLLKYGATHRQYEAEEVIFLENSEGIYYHQLESGSVRWVNIAEDGSEYIQSMIEPGECFGEFPVFDHLPYASSAIANTKSVVVRLAIPSFIDLLKQNPTIHLAFSAMLTRRLRFRFMLLNEQAHSTPEELLYTLIQYFKKNTIHICSTCNRLNLTRQQLANMTGLRVETVIRSIKHLAAKGLLTIEHGKVYCH